MSVPTIGLAGNHMRQFDVVHDASQIFIRHASALNVLDRMRVDDLVSERSVGEVGPLRDVEDPVDFWLCELAALSGPELAKDSEEGGLAAAVRPGDEQVHAWLDLEVHFADELITVRAENRDVLKDDVI